MLTAPAPYLRAALINDIIAIFDPNSSLYNPVLLSRSLMMV